MITVKLYIACSSSSMPILSDMFFNTPIVPDTSSSCSSCCSAINWGKHKKRALCLSITTAVIGCLIDQVLRYLLLNLLLLYELRVGILQLTVQPAIFIRTGLPDRTLCRLTKQSLSSTTQRDTVRHVTSAAAWCLSPNPTHKPPDPPENYHWLRNSVQMFQRFQRSFRMSTQFLWQLSDSLSGS